MITSMLRRAQLTSGCLADDAPGQVGGLTATASGQTTINLQWNADGTAAPNTATAYQVERSVDGLGSWTLIGTVEAPTVTFSDTSLSASTTRHYRVRATNCNSAGLESTSANATTAAAGLSPSWSLDFSSGSFSGATLTRASTGTYVDSSGYIASASTDIARLTHNSSGSRLGLLVEGQTTNYARASQDFTNTTWWPTTFATVTANSGTSPDGTNNAFLITDVTGNSPHSIGGSNIGSMPTTALTASVYVKKPTSGGSDYAFVQMFFNGSPNTTGTGIVDLTTGAITATSAGGFTNFSATAVDAGNGWWRMSITGTPNAGGSIGRISVGPSASTTTGYNTPSGGPFKSILAWGAQFENSARGTSYINTTTASVTRSADLAHVLDSSITSWGDPGALVVHFYPPGQAGTLISTDDASTAQVGIEASTTTAARAFWSSGSTATGTIGTGVQKAVHYWTGSTSKFAINGGTVQSGTNNFTIANADFVTLGAEATESGGVPGTFSQYANCVIRKVEFYSGTLTDANIQTITT